VTSPTRSPTAYLHYALRGIRRQESVTRRPALLEPAGRPSSRRVRPSIGLRLYERVRLGATAWWTPAASLPTIRSALPSAPEAAISTYRVAIDVYEGPLDVLLRLIEREELDVTRVSLAVVADQYLAHIALLRELSAANLADFLVIAARLLVIKSRHLLPREEDDPDEAPEEDVGEDLARQLREYRRYKEAASNLRRREEAGQRSFSRAAPPPPMTRPMREGELPPAVLLEALCRALAARPPDPPVDGVVPPVIVRIADCIETVRRAVRHGARARLSALLREARSRLEMIVTVLAVLEMIKQQELRATQEHPFGEVLLERRTPDPGADIAPLDLSEYGEPLSPDAE